MKAAKKVKTSKLLIRYLCIGALFPTVKRGSGLSHATSNMGIDSEEGLDRDLHDLEYFGKPGRPRRENTFSPWSKKRQEEWARERANFWPEKAG